MIGMPRHNRIRVLFLLAPMTLAAGALEAANGFCWELSYAGRIPAAFGDCRVWEGSPEEGFVIAYDEGWGDRPEGARAARLEDTRLALSKTVTFFKGLRVEIPDPLLFFVTDRDYPDRFGIPTNYYAFNLRQAEELRGPCWMGLNPIGFELDQPRYLQTMAHEVGHCMIDDYTGSLSSGLDEGLDRRWYEGVAEYLANQVFVSPDAENQFVSEFAADLELFDDDYKNMCFFQHYGNERGGPAAVLELAKKLADLEDTSDFLPVLDGVADSAELWHGFGLGLAEQSIADIGSGGADGVLPTRPLEYFSEEEISLAPDSGERTLTPPIPVLAYTVFDQKFSLAEAGRYRFQPPDIDRGEVRVSIERDGAWIPLTEEVTVETCGETEEIRMVLSMTAASRGDVNPSLAYSGERNEACCIDTGRRDPCVMGAWELDASRLDRFVAGQLRTHRRPGDADAPERDVTSRGWLKADGTGRLVTRMHLVVEMPRTVIASQRLTTDSRSDIEVTWSTADGMLHLCRQGGRHEVTQTTDIATSNPATGESMEGHYVVDYVDGEVVGIDGHVSMEPPRDADAEERADVRASEERMNRQLREAGPEGVPGMGTLPSFPDPWANMGPVPYSCSDDSLDLQMTPGMTASGGSRTMTLPPMHFYFQRLHGAPSPDRLTHD